MSGREGMDGNVLPSEIPARFLKKKTNLIKWAWEMRWWIGMEGRWLRVRAAWFGSRLLPASQVEVREPQGCRSCALQSLLAGPLGLRSETLLSQTPSLARRTGRSLGRKSL